ncbi:hypothetical protein [Flavobacterium hibernum]|nr:hypothetical protein [Flavobacterium hibernum]STO18527.1 Uncharacterised protein [Flavobacterium hibernum]
MVQKIIKSTLLAFFFICKLTSQVVNYGDMYLMQNTPVKTFFNFQNTATGDLLQDGSLYVNANFKNEGLVRYNVAQNGTTFFSGNQTQIIEGSETSYFQNIVFDNITSTAPFHLASNINIGKNASFKNGIIDADTYNGKMIFDENAFHSNASNLSFVDGKVENLGNLQFEFPIGDEIYFRPSINNKAGDDKNIYTTQFFFKIQEPCTHIQVKIQKFSLLTKRNTGILFKTKELKKK